MKQFDPFNQRDIPDAALQEHLQLCQEIFLKMQKDGTCPWPDSQNSENLLESDDT